MASSSSLGNGRNFEAVFTSGKSKYTVTVTEAGNISWIQTGSGGQEHEGPRETVPREELLAVSILTKQATDEAGGFVLSYIEHQKKHILRPAHISFAGASEDCQQMVDTVQGLIRTAPLRPRKALVIINPASGGWKGVQTYEKKVSPIFASFGLSTIVIVTERPRQAEEIMSEYDLDSIDSIVVVGGDGTYHEVANGLLLRIQKKAGIDIKDPDAPLKELTIPIGLVPAGTGNGIANCCYGNLDAETAALSIIKGQRKGFNACSVFTDGKFQMFSILSVAYGVFGDLMYTAENHRYLGRLRYPFSVLDTLLIRYLRVMDLTIEYLTTDNAGAPTAESAGITDTGKEGNPQVQLIGRPVEADIPESEQQVLEADTAAQAMDSDVCPTGTGVFSSQPRSVWQTEQKAAVGVGLFQTDLFGALVGKDITENSGGLFINRPCTTWQLAKFFFRLFTFSKYLLDDGLVEHMSCCGLRVKLKSASKQDTDTGRKERIVTVDGEIFTVNDPKFEVRLHKGTVKLFYGVEDITAFVDKDR